MLKLGLAFFALGLSAALPAAAQTTGGATLAGGDNGHAAQVDQTMKSQGSGMTSKSGAPSAMPGHGQSTEHADGKMRAHKNF